LIDKLLGFPELSLILFPQPFEVRAGATAALLTLSALA
jgi:hypothetical protein